jgi:hypothetical protein
MRNLDKVIAGFIIALILFVYIAADLTFEMYTEYRSWRYATGVYVLSLLLVSYYGIKYIKPKKASFYFGLLVSSALLWICLLITGQKISLLYAAAIQPTVTTTLAIDHVEKNLHKGSLAGSKVFIRHDRALLNFSSSRTNYFALKDKREIKTELGTTGAGNYYVSRIYWHDGERSAARKAYWHYWANRYWIIPVLIAGLLVFLFIADWLRKKSIIKSKPRAGTPKSIGLLYLKIMGIIAALFLLCYLILLLYMFIRHGGLHP